MATTSRKSKLSKDADKKTSRKSEEEVIRSEESQFEVLEQTSSTLIEHVNDSNYIPLYPEPEPVYEEPILTKLIVESYEGDIVRGLYDGYGSACFVGRHQYKGQFSEGLMHGVGCYQWSDGVIYEGDFLKNHITGKGKYTWTDGSTYEGDVVDGIRHGVGKFICPCKDITYIGDWVMGKQTGKGRLNYDPDGVVYYDGEWVDNVRHGFGIRRYPSGNIYEGTWYKNQRHGLGTMQWFDKQQSYTGNWQNGCQHGMGQQVWYLRRGATTQYSLRNMYDGELCYGKRHGFGTFHYANGARYEGEWNNNVKCGKGKFVFKNGRIYEGLFEDDHIVEFPTFEMDALCTPDVSRIRTRTPLPFESGSSVQNESVNTFSPSFHLDVENLLQELVDVDREEEESQIAFVVTRHMTSLHRVYLFYSRLGHDDNPDNTFVMTRMQFWRFLKDCHLHDTEYGLVDMDRWLCKNTRSASSFEEMHNPYGQILFREFLDHLVIIAFYLNRQYFSSPILASCMSHLITENIFKHACVVKGSLYLDVRRTANALVHMDELFRIYRGLCKPSKCEPSDYVLTMRQFMLALKDMNLLNQDLTAKTFISVMASDDPKVIDSQGGVNMELEIVFCEFFEAILECAQIYVTESTLDTIILKMSSHALNESFDGLVGSQTSKEKSTNPSTHTSTNTTTNTESKDLTVVESSLPTSASGCGVDESFNIWTRRMHTFCVQKFFPGSRVYFEVLNRLDAAKQRKHAGISVESCQQLGGLAA